MVRDHAEVGQRRGIPVPLGNLRSRRCVGDDQNLKALLNQFAHMGFCTQVGGHAGQDYLTDASLAQLQNEIIAFRPVNLVRAGHDGLAVINVVLVAFEPVGARTLEAFERQGVFAVKHADRVHEGFEGTLHFPAMIVGIVVMRRNEHRHVHSLGCCKQGVDVFDRAVFFDILANHAPRDTVRTEKIVLRIGNYQSGASGHDVHTGIWQAIRVSCTD